MYKIIETTCGTKLLKREKNSHFNLNGTPKIGYDSEKEAQYYCYIMNTNINNKYVSVVYKCNHCNKFHIGHTQNLLTMRKIERYTKKLKLNNKLF